MTYRFGGCSDGLTSATIPPMNRTKRSLFIGVLLGILVMGATALAGDLGQVSQHIGAFNWSLTPWILGAACFSYAVRFVKWHFLVRRAGASGITPASDARIFLSGFPLSVTPGKVGEALKAVWLDQTAGLPMSGGLSVVLADRLSDGLAMVLLSTIGIVALPSAWPAFGLAAGALVLVITLSQFRQITLRILALVNRLPLVGHLGPSATRFYEAAHRLLRPKPALAAVMLGAVAWCGEGAATFGVLVGLGQTPSLELLSIAVFAFAFSTIIGALSALPGGLGATEASLAGLLALLLSLPAAIAVAATLLLRLATLWFAVMIGLATWAVSPNLVLARSSSRNAEFVKKGTIGTAPPERGGGERSI
jgi:uncharacterized protein (TIRG00374 family)